MNRDAFKLVLYRCRVLLAVRPSYPGQRHRQRGFLDFFFSPRFNLRLQETRQFREVEQIVPETEFQKSVSA